jgi:hypothetical protein
MKTYLNNHSCFYSGRGLSFTVSPIFCGQYAVYLDKFDTHPCKITGGNR